MTYDPERHPGSVELLVDDPLDLGYSDEELKAAVVDPEGSLALWRDDATTWLRAAVAVGEGSEPSQVTDTQLFNKFTEGRLDEWDPTLTAPVTAHLRDEGFFVFN